MLRRPLVPILLALALLGAGIGIGAAIGHDGWGRHRDAVTVATVGGDAAHPGQTIVVSDGYGWHHGFFPFGLLFFPLLILLVLALLRRGRGCGPWSRGGPGGPGGGPGGTPTAV